MFGCANRVAMAESARVGGDDSTGLVDIDCLVWVRLRGFPWWPAQVTNLHSKGIDVIFLGTGDHATVAEAEPFHLSDRETDERFRKAMKPSLRAKFAAAIAEAEDLLSRPPPSQPPPVEKQQQRKPVKVKSTASDDGGKPKKKKSSGGTSRADAESGEGSSQAETLPKARQQRGRPASAADALRNPSAHAIDTMGFAEISGLLPSELCARIAAVPMADSEGISNGLHPIRQQPPNHRR